MKNIATIWGWTGSYNVLKSLFWKANISAIVWMSDDGGSTGRIRDEYGVLPSWDIRRAILALSSENSENLRKLFNYRFENWVFKGHSLWNLIMLASEDIAWNYVKWLNMIEEMFDVEGKIYPISLEKTRLLAKLENWEYVFWETNIDVPVHNSKVEKIMLIKDEKSQAIKDLMELVNNKMEYIFSQANYNWEKQWVKNLLSSLIQSLVQDNLPTLNRKIPQVIENADYIIVCPWDLYTSILPNFLVDWFANMVKKSSAKKILIANIFTKKWETDNYKLSDFLRVFESIIWKDIFDTILVNDTDKTLVQPWVREKYEQEWKEFIRIDICDTRIIKADLTKQTDLVRHDIEKLSQVLQKIIK